MLTLVNLAVISEKRQPPLSQVVAKLHAPKMHDAGARGISAERTSPSMLP